MIRLHSPFLALLISASLALALPSPLSSYLPVVIWHGLGDSATSDGMLSVADDIRSLYPGIFVHNIFLDPTQAGDRNAGFFGNVVDQIEYVAEELAGVVELEEGFDAIGFSQGGQFLRAFVEMYNYPPVHNLITFGSQHMGIADLPACKPNDFLCKIAFSAVRRGVYTPYAQSHLVQAQYYRDQDRLDLYLATNSFLAQVNNERLDQKNLTYASNFATLSNLILLRFTKEETVVPAISSWFGSLAPLNTTSTTFEPSPPPSSSADTDPSPHSSQRQPEPREEIPMEEQPLYREDWIGLRELDEGGVVRRDWCEGAHMEIGGCWKEVLDKWVGTKTGSMGERGREIKSLGLVIQ